MGMALGRFWSVGAVGLAAVAAVFLASCERVTGTGAPTSGGGSSATTIDIDGSSTTVLITEAVTHEFRAVDPGTSVSISVTGTGGGFKRFCTGETDISNASRPIKASELEMAQRNGVEFVELPVAFDGLTIAVHPGNTWVDSLTVAELKHIFRAENPARTWADVREGWPARPIALWAPGQASGTFDFFQEVVFADKSPMRIGDVSMSEDDHILVRGIAGDADALGFFGFAYFEANKDRVRAVPIDGGSGPVTPTIATIRDGSYAPLSRPLFIYVNARSLGEPHVRRYVDFYLDSAAELSEEVRYVALPDEVYGAAREIVAKPVTGTRWLNAAGDHIHTPVTEVYGVGLGTGSAEAQAQ
jgi:phosphate transport system substrate-binding protein